MQRQMRYTAWHEADAIRRLEENNKQLYFVKLPLAGLLGSCAYTLWSNLHNGSRIVRDFNKLLEAQELIMSEIDGLLTNKARLSQPLPGGLKTALSQLRETLQAGNSPVEAMRHMDAVRQQASGQVQTAKLDDALQEYLTRMNRILKNKAGLEALAGEPLVRRALGVSKRTAQIMARHNREAFIGELFGKVIHGLDPKALRAIFTRLSQVHFRTARLVAMFVSIGLGGYFIVDNEVKSKRIATGG